MKKIKVIIICIGIFVYVNSSLNINAFETINKVSYSEQKSKLQVVYKKTKTLERGKTKVVDKGQAGYKKYKITEKIVDGKQITTKELVINKKSRKKVINVGTKIPTTAFRKLGACESNNRHRINTGNGYYGEYQYNLATWVSNAKKVNVKTYFPHLATRSEQLKVARYTQSKRGWAPWGYCGTLAKKVDLKHKAEMNKKFKSKRISF